MGADYNSVGNTRRVIFDGGSGFFRGIIFVPAFRFEIMAGLDASTPVPTSVVLHQQSRLLELTFDDGTTFQLPHEFLRVYSPSAEVRGHGVGQEVLQTGKREVTLLRIEPVGRYALKLVFSDGHDSGLYSWDYLHLLGREYEALWQAYLERLAATGASRDPGDAPPQKPHGGGGCGHRH